MVGFLSSICQATEEEQPMWHKEQPDTSGVEHKRHIMKDNRADFSYSPERANANESMERKRTRLELGWTTDWDGQQTSKR